MIILDRKQLEGIALLHQQHVVAGRDGQCRQHAPLHLLAQQLGLTSGVEEADGAILACADEALAKVLRGQQIHRAIAFEITDLGELALAILGHFEPLGDDTIVVTHQQRRGTGEQLDPGHVGIGGIDLHDVAQGDVIEVVDVVDREAVSLTHEQNAQIGGQQHLIHMTRQGGDAVVLGAPLHFTRDEILLATHHRHHAAAIFGHGGGGHLVLGGLKYHQLQRLALGIDHHGLFAEGIFQAGLDDPHIIGIGNLEIGLHHQGFAIGKPVGDELLARRRAGDRRDVTGDLSLANGLPHLDLAIRLNGKEVDQPLVAEAIADLVLLFHPEPGCLAFNGQAERRGRLHGGAVENRFHHIKQIEKNEQQGHQHQSTTSGDSVLGQLILDPAFSTARHDQVDRFR